jgi:hypothetical protein
VTKDKEILQTLKNYGFVKNEDIRMTFSGETSKQQDDNIPEPNSDLEAEMQVGKEDRDHKFESKRNGQDFIISSKDGQKYAEERANSQTVWSKYLNNKEYTPSTY